MVQGYQQDMACREVISSFSMPSTAGKKERFGTCFQTHKSPAGLKEEQKQNHCFYTSVEVLARSLLNPL